MKTLSLQGCPEVNDWFLARLHIFQDSLEELDISHCPRITIGGLPALRNLKYVFKYNISQSFSHYIWCDKCRQPHLFLCGLLQKTTASRCVITPQGFKPWFGLYPAGGNVTTLSHHCHWLQSQSEAGK